VATVSEIQMNDWRLSIPLYVRKINEVVGLDPSSVVFREWNEGSEKFHETCDMMFEALKTYQDEELI